MNSAIASSGGLRIMLEATGGLTFEHRGHRNSAAKTRPKLSPYIGGLSGREEIVTPCARMRMRARRDENQGHQGHQATASITPFKFSGLLIQERWPHALFSRPPRGHREATAQHFWIFTEATRATKATGDGVGAT